MKVNVVFPSMGFVLGLILDAFVVKELSDCFDMYRPSHVQYLISSTTLKAEWVVVRVYLDAADVTVGVH